MIDREFAEKEFDRFIESMDIFDASNDEDADDAKSFRAARNLIVGAIQRERVTINDDGEPTIHMSDETDPITMSEPTGAALMAMDGKGKGREIAQMYAAMGQMCGISPKTFSAMKQRDLKIFQNLAILFLA